MCPETRGYAVDNEGKDNKEVEHHQAFPWMTDLLALSVTFASWRCRRHSFPANPLSFAVARIAMNTAVSHGYSHQIQRRKSTGADVTQNRAGHDPSSF